MSIQQNLFGLPQEEPKKPKKDDLMEQMERVRSRLELSLMEFWGTMEIGDEFHAQDLYDYVIAAGIVCAPDSPGRLMRLFRKKGFINYMLVSARESLYRVLPTSGESLELELLDD